MTEEVAARWFQDEQTLGSQWFANFADAIVGNLEIGALMTRPLARMVGGPWHHGRMTLINDAAHAITPFLGQGMNCALKDCAALVGHLHNKQADPARAFKDFYHARRQDTDAIAALSAMNCREMMEDSPTPRYRRRKQLEAMLCARFPNTFVSHYALVTFGHRPYAEILQIKQRQDELMDTLLRTAIDDRAIDGWPPDAQAALERYFQHAFAAETL